MVIIPALISYIYPGIVFGSDYNIIDQADGNGPQLIDWSYPQPQPTEAQLEAAWPNVEDDYIWASTRNTRDWKLQQSDWTQLSDVSIPNKADWVTYRQELRDVTKDFPTPQDVIWPVPPA